MSKKLVKTICFVGVFLLVSGTIVNGDFLITERFTGMVEETSEKKRRK